MSLSYWEYKQWFTDIDFCIVGSGIVGLNCAIHLKKLYPKKKVLILERSSLPNGASTKNAGFACFGSLSELIADLEVLSENELLELITKRINGLKLLRAMLGDDAIDYKQHGSYELFFNSEEATYQNCLAQTERINRLLYPLFETDVFQWKDNHFSFNQIHPKICFNPFEGQIDTGKMMNSLLKKSKELNIELLNGVEVIEFQDENGGVVVQTKAIEFKVNQLFIATNGFARQLTNKSVKPARAQVLITEPIENLHVKGTFHIDEGFYYFRNIENRILLGGGRNLDLQKEETEIMEINELIQNRLEEILQQIIFPKKEVKVEQRWTGIMGVGDKQPIVTQLSDNVFVGVRLGGMGIAIGSQIGQDLANLFDLSSSFT